MLADEPDQCPLDRDRIIEKKQEVDRKRQTTLKRMEILAQESELLANNLKEMEVEDKHWDAELAHLGNANVPILCLPNEITSFIFEMARGQSKFDNDHPDEGPWSRYWAHVKGRPEILVSHVCRSWRWAAISCPTIWSHIIIHDWFAEGTVKPAQRLSTYLTRSRDTLLDIVVNIKTTSHNDIDCTDALRDFLLAVIPHSARWQRLLIWVHGKWTISPFSLLAGIAAPQLEIFESGGWSIYKDFYYRTRVLEGMPGGLTLFQLGAPKLKHVLACSQLLLPSQSRNISTVYIQQSEKRQPWEQFTALISLPNLRNLTLDGPIFQGPKSSSPVTRTVTSRLRYLRLGCPIASRYMWDTISAPKLMLLALFEMQGLNITSRESTFPQGFFPSLKTIVLSKVEITRPEDLLHLALATFHVKTLTICDCRANTVLMLSLYEYSFMKHAQLWPDLQNLTYVVTEPKLCFGNRGPKTYKEAREILLQLVDWRLEAFSCRCAILIWMAHLRQHRRDEDHRFLWNNSPPYNEIPLFDDCTEEEEHWWKLFMPRKHGRLIPWPEKETIGTGYYGKLKFTNDYLMYSDDEE